MSPHFLDWKSLRPFLGIALLPGLLWFLLQLPPLFDLGTLDGMYYYGYSFNFKELILRYGFPYYSVRFSTIFLSIIFATLFGPVYGFMMMGWTFSAAIGICLYIYFSKRFDKTTAWVSVILWNVNPAVLLMMIYPYCIAQAIFMAFLGNLLCLITTESLRNKQRWSLYWSEALTGIVAGILFMGAGCAHTNTAFIVFPAALGWLIAYIFAWRSVLKISFFTLIGGGLTLGFGSLVYGQMFKMPWILLPLIEVTQRIGTAETDVYIKPFHVWFNSCFYSFVAPLLIIAGFVLSLWCYYKGPSSADHNTADEADSKFHLLLTFSGAIASLAGITAIYWYLDFVKKLYFLTYFHYFIFFIPAITILLAVIFGALQQSSLLKRVYWWQIAILGILLTAVSAYGSLAYNAQDGYALLSVASVTMALCIAGLCFMPSGWRIVAYGCICATAFGLISLSPGFRRADFEESRAAIDHALIGRQLTKIVPKVEADWRPIYFMYNRMEGDRAPVHIHSTQLYSLNLFNAKNYGALPFERLPEDRLDILRNQPVSRLYVLADQAHELPKMKDIADSITRGGVQCRIENHVLESGKVKLNVCEVIFPTEVEKAKSFKGINQPASHQWTAIEGTAVQRDSAWKITSGKCVWSAAAVLSLLDCPRGADLMLRVKVDEGHFAFHLGEHRRVFVAKTLGWVDVRLPSAWLEGQSNIPLLNVGLKGLPSIMEVSGAQWLVPTDSLVEYNGGR